MSFLLWTGICAVLAAIAYFLFIWLPRRRLHRALSEPFPPQWESWLLGLPWYSRLPPELKADLQRKVQGFLHEKKFSGCEGLEVSDQMRVLIAGQACTLLLNRPTTGYRRLRWIYLFPTTFRSRHLEQDEDGLVSNTPSSFLGVSWGNGRVVLAWDSVLAGLADRGDGHNVVLHEFAHQLDQEDGSADGAPLLYTREGYDEWSKVLGHEFERLRSQLRHGRHGLIDEYGATHPAEFFAVVTELFYQRPGAMAGAYPELFKVLGDYYRVDPREWREDATGPALHHAPGTAFHDAPEKARHHTRGAAHQPAPGWPGECPRGS